MPACNGEPELGVRAANSLSEFFEGNLFPSIAFFAFPFSPRIYAGNRRLQYILAFGTVYKLVAHVERKLGLSNGVKE